MSYVGGEALESCKRKQKSGCCATCNRTRVTGKSQGSTLVSRSGNGEHTQQSHLISQVMQALLRVYSTAALVLTLPLSRSRVAKEIECCTTQEHALCTALTNRSSLSLGDLLARTSLSQSLRSSWPVEVRVAGRSRGMAQERTIAPQ